MDKQIKFSDQPLKAKIIYGVVVAILCISAIVIGIVSAASQKNKNNNDTPPPASDNGTTDENNGSSNDETNKNESENEDKKPAKLTYVSPLVGEITENHSIDTPVFSDTLGEWRVHTGIDISAEAGANVYAAAAGTVSRVYSDAMLGKTVEITHEDGVVTRYSNLSDSVNVKSGDTVASGAKIGTIGDSSISELAEEPHLHLEFLVGGVSVNPLDYICEESKEASLGIFDV